MLEDLPLHIPVLFGITTLATLLLFFRALMDRDEGTLSKGDRWILISLLLWLFIQSVISFSGVYTRYPDALPPTVMLFGILPPVGLIIGLFISRKGRRFIDSLSLQRLTILHVIRIPVELILYALFLNGAAPELMTFEGRNFDILAGITAPLVTYLGFVKMKIGSNLLLAWNCISLSLLLNIVVNAFLSAPSPLQQLAFDQPNIAILYFPFSWLPTFIVPVVLFSHLAAIRQLLVYGKTFEEFNKVTSRSIELLRSLSEEQLNFQPKKGWSAAQFGSHLLKSYAFVEVLNGKTKRTERPIGQKLGPLKVLFADQSVKMEAPEAILPSKQHMVKEELIRQLDDRVGQVKSVIRTKDLSLTCTDLSIPEYGEFTRFEWVWFNIYHTERHIEQLENMIVAEIKTNLAK